MTPLGAIGYAWIAWLASWSLAALWATRTVKRPAQRDELRTRILIPIGAFVLFWRWDSATGLAGAAGWAMFAIVCAGFLFAWWARVHLGRLWSGHVTFKEGHRIVDTGAYGIVRHPIYTGMTAAALATGIAEWRVQAIAGATLIGIGFWLRARLEERFLGEELGREAYDEYARRVPMLIPFSGPGRRD